MHPLFRGSFGYANALHITDPAAARAADARMDAALAAFGWRHRADGPVRTILILLPATSPSEAAVMDQARRLRSRHILHIHVDSRDGVTRFAKLNALAAETQITFDWLIVIDDDVACAPDFIDAFVDAIEAAAFVLANPAHRIHSYASFAVTQRVANSIARRTAFVETGPVVAFHRSILGALLPFPEAGWGWGADFLWAERARAAGWRIGIVDGAPIEHVRPPAAGYQMRGAMVAANALLAGHALTITRETMLAPGEVVIGLPPRA